MRPNPKGAAGEDYAAKVIEGMGYKILGRNFSSRYGEVDLIASKDDIIAFIEIKTRKTGSMVSGFGAVTASKQRKIIATALWYLKARRCDMQPRFDVFSVVTKADGEILSHDYLEGAFDSGAYPQSY